MSLETGTVGMSSTVSEKAPVEPPRVQLSWSPTVETLDAAQNRSIDGMASVFTGSDTKSVSKGARNTVFSTASKFQSSIQNTRTAGNRKSVASHLTLCEKLALLGDKSSAKSSDPTGTPAVLATLACRDQDVPIPSVPITDPSTFPAFREATAVSRQQVFYAAHWGRSSLAEYSSTSAVAADSMWRILQGTTTEKDADVRVLTGIVRATKQPAPVIADAKAELEKVLRAVEGGCSEDDVRGAVQHTIEGEDLDAMRKLQEIFIRVGCYALAADVVKRRLELLHDTRGPGDPDTLAANHALGVVLQRGGFHMDAEKCFQAALQGSTMTSDELEEVVCDSEVACESAVCLCVSLREQGQLVEAEERLQVIVAVAAMEFGQDHVQTLCAVGELAVTHVRQQRVQEAAVLQHVFQAHVASLGTEHPTTLEAWANLAFLQAAQGQRDAAIESYEQVLLKRRALYGATHPETLSCERLLAIHSNSPAGKFEQLMLQWSALRGSESVHALCVLHDMGVRLCRANNYAEAVNVFQRAYQGFSHTCGPYHKATVDTCSKIFSALSAQGNNPHPDAGAHLQTVHIAVHTRCGPYHVDTWKSANNVAVLHYRNLRYTEAFRVLKEECISPWLKQNTRKTVELKTTVLFSPRSAGVGATEEAVYWGLVQQNYAFACTENDRFADAETTFMRVWEDWKRLLGAEHTNTLMAMNNYGVSLKTSRNLHEAEKILSAVAALREQVLGPDDLDTLESYCNLGIAQKIARKYKEAFASQSRAYEKRKALLGEKHADTIDSAYFMSLWMTDNGRHEEAERLMRSCITNYNEALGDLHPAQYHSLTALGIIYAAQDKDVESLVFFNDALTGLGRIFGEKNLQFLLVVHNTAIQQYNSGFFESALATYKRALDGYTAIFGHAHPTPVWIAMQTGRCHYVMGELNEATPYFDWAKDGFEQIRQSDMSGLDHGMFAKLASVEEMLRDTTMVRPTMLVRFGGSLVRAHRWVTKYSSP
eukprot:GEMP01006294.1.p1 GENE.GEMP01006294.1~~GEMP01006294.1.p1  ORF type:complete len:1013 (-),score=278.15 GEMP01006294.1:816-3794(-)